MLEAAARERRRELETARAVALGLPALDAETRGASAYANGTALDVVGHA